MDMYTIREASLSGCNKKIKAALISDRNREIWKWIRDKRQASASDVANHFNISIQNASGSLSKMYKQLYLRRYKRPQESGGYEWVYYL